MMEIAESLTIPQSIVMAGLIIAFAIWTTGKD